MGIMVCQRVQIRAIRRKNYLDSSIRIIKGTTLLLLPDRQVFSASGRGIGRAAMQIGNIMYMDTMEAQIPGSSMACSGRAP